MFVGTIHSYCLKLLQEHVPRYAAFDVLDEHRLAALVSREYDRLHLADLGVGYPWQTIRVFLRNVDFVENELIDLEDLDRGTFAVCYRKFVEMLDGYRLLTYGQLISKAVAEFQNQATAKRVRKDLKHLIVDEYQDINPAQEELIRRLAASPVELCVVGDDDQCIYQWRGSDVSNIVTFAGRRSAVHTETLEVNRRSRPSIVTAWPVGAPTGRS